ncbi:hypothetical protein LFL96_36940 (plasmid) [Paraburkholderia sp. D15]|uniref:hypothetical protein n=1 Tax=Paraburkholderia sp. D15 TaxID=2880218 RepID=UPI0024791022|nr:hypothetical protein [Paraburkholderia sp. D15]WGS55066.1 hypothetical protein LFL96_36940 [Paraburkholderia sp. D15]
MMLRGKVNQKGAAMIDFEKRAYDAMHAAFCRVRLLSRRPVSEKEREHLFLLADAAHNIPDALAGDTYHRTELERDVLALETLLAEPHDMTSGGRLTQRVARVSSLEQAFQLLKRIVTK